MKHKLASFTEFANQLYPHEADYLHSIARFQKDENKKILETILFNCHRPAEAKEFDPEIDKRSYSYVKKWIVESLARADVDRFYEWILATEKQVMLDAISPAEEREIISYLKVIGPTHYCFLRFYELVQHFRDYLLIRVRHIFYRPTNIYLMEHEQDYIRCLSVNKGLNEATVGIIRHHESPELAPLEFTDFLHQSFSNPQLDGYTRYRAAVRLTFHYYNFREFEKLLALYNRLDEEFKTDLFYSKRLLSNYYSNRAMMHSKLNELNKAEHYGYLSIRQKNSDYLFYLANLCGILLRNKKHEKALRLMSQSIPELKNTNSFYNKIGFVSFYVRTLVANSKAKNAASYASTFLDAYRKEIFETRWHLFFSAYLQALLYAGKTQQIIAVSHRYKLVALEKKHIESSVYTPVLYWHTEVALYIEGRRTRSDLIETISSSAIRLLNHSYQSGRLNELLEQFYDFIPAEVEEIRQRLIVYKEGLTQTKR
ncbi:MAG: hypothetical protein H3C41_05985 [Bacteroidales bacterium]|nr:hypothetical protein [Bacteroidales bacterium]